MNDSFLRNYLLKVILVLPKKPCGQTLLASFFFLVGFGIYAYSQSPPTTVDLANPGATVSLEMNSEWTQMHPNSHFIAELCEQGGVLRVEWVCDESPTSYPTMIAGWINVQNSLGEVLELFEVTTGTGYVEVVNIDF